MRKTIPFSLVQIENDGFHPIVKAYYNRHPLNLVIDTGASRTVVNKSMLTHLKPIENEHIEPLAAGINAQQFSVSLYTIDRFTISHIRFTNFEVFGADLSGLAKMYKSMVGFPLHGMLGSDFLIKYNAQLDFKKRVMIVST